MNKEYAKEKAKKDEPEPIKVFDINLNEMEEVDEQDGSNLLKEYLPKKSEQ